MRRVAGPFGGRVAGEPAGHPAGRTATRVFAALLVGGAASCAVVPLPTRTMAWAAGYGVALGALRFLEATAPEPGERQGLGYVAMGLAVWATFSLGGGLAARGDDAWWRFLQAVALCTTVSMASTRVLLAATRAWTCRWCGADGAALGPATPSPERHPG